MGEAVRVTRWTRVSRPQGRGDTAPALAGGITELVYRSLSPPLFRPYGPRVSTNVSALLVPALVVTVTRYSPGGSTSGGTSLALGMLFGTAKVIRPSSVDSTSRIFIGPNSTRFRVRVKPVPRIVT